MSAELRYQSSRTEKLIAENDHLKQESKQAKREMQLSDEMQGQMANRVRFYERLFRKMEQRDKSKLEDDSKFIAQAQQQSAPVHDTPHSQTHNRKPAYLSDEGALPPQVPHRAAFREGSPAGGDSVVLNTAPASGSIWLQQSTVDGEAGGLVETGVDQESWDQENVMLALEKCISIIREKVDETFNMSSLISSPEKPPATLQATLVELDSLLALREKTAKNTESIMHYNLFLKNKVHIDESQAGRGSHSARGVNRPTQPPKRGRNPRLSNNRRHQQQAPRQQDEFKDWVIDSMTEDSKLPVLIGSKTSR